ncbi:MAG: hypothetical protein HQL58_03955 [Magnetococcales bacterium]|nr:hypothetical protein [Magnetococcales bacterium]
MTAETVRQRLTTHNPFASAVVGDPWQARLTDVPTINSRIFEGIGHLLGQLAQHPQEALAAVVLGEVGYGKSHLITRLRQYCQQQQPFYLFAWLSPPESGDEPCRYLLRTIADSWHNPSSGVMGASIWQTLASLVVAEGQGPERQRRILQRILSAKGRPRHWWKTIRDIVTPRNELVQPLLWLTGSPRKRRVATAWLRGDRVKQSLLGGNDHQDGSEQRARTLLMALGQLLGRYHIPLLLCFDRLEELRNPAQDAAMDTLLTFLVDRVESVLPVVFARGQLWEQLRTSRWNAQTVGRLESNRFEMTGCGREQAIDLVRSRLHASIGPEVSGSLFFDPVRLLDRLAPGRHSPRVVITLANRRLQELLEQRPLPAASPHDVLTNHWEQMTAAMMTHPVPMPLRPKRLLLALSLLLSADPDHIDWDTLEIANPTSSGSTANLWLVESAFHHKAVLKGLKRGLQWLMVPSHGGMAYYVRDGRYVIPPAAQWPATNRVLQKFQQCGGRVISLGPERVARWYALADLSEAARAGDISYIDDQEREITVTHEMLTTFVQTVGFSIHDRGPSSQ